MDSELSVLSFDRFAPGVRANLSFSDWLVDSDGYYITCGTRYDEEYYIENRRILQYPVIIKIDPMSLDIVWEAPLSGDVYLDWNYYFNSIVETHDGDGYIAVGGGYVSDTDSNGADKMIYGKVSKSGESIWYKEIIDEYHQEQSGGILPRKIIATSDGYYMACGDRSDTSPDDGYDTRVQMFLVKFDEDGNLLNTTNTSDLTETSTISIFPNPSVGQLTIETAHDKIITIRITDINGQLIRTKEGCFRTCSMDVSNLAPAQYYVLISDDNDRLISQEKIIIE